MHTTLDELYFYNDWAHDVLFQAARDLPPAALDHPVQMGLGSLRATLQHIWAAEHVWLERWKGNPPPAVWQTDPALTVAALREMLRDVAAERRALVARRGPGGPRERIRFTGRDGQPYDFALGDLMLHVANHGVHHRAQAVNMLRQVGVKLRNFDYLFFRVEQPTARHPAPEVVGRFTQAGWNMQPGLATPAAFDGPTIQEFFHFTDWARRRVHSLAEDLSAELLDRPFEMGPGSLRKVLLHTLDAELNWLANWTRGSTPGFDELSPATPLPELSILAEQTAAARNAFLAPKSDADLLGTLLAQPNSSTQLHFRLGETMLQVCLHATHHRAQAVNMLRQLGAKPPGVDYIEYARERQGAA